VGFELSEHRVRWPRVGHAPDPAARGAEAVLTTEWWAVGRKCVSVPSGTSRLWVAVRFSCASSRSWPCSAPVSNASIGERVMPRPRGKPFCGARANSSRPAPKQRVCILPRLHDFHHSGQNIHPIGARAVARCSTRLNKTRKLSQGHRIAGKQFDPMAASPNAGMASRDDSWEPSLSRIYRFFSCHWSAASAPAVAVRATIHRNPPCDSLGTSLPYGQSLLIFRNRVKPRHQIFSLRRGPNQMHSKPSCPDRGAFPIVTDVGMDAWSGASQASIVNPAE